MFSEAWTAITVELLRLAATISMWQNLAPELVFGILRHFHPNGLKLSTTEPTLFPWYLGQICSSWRDVFISYPAFWNNFIIHLEPHDFPAEQCNIDVYRALAILKACLPRSRNRPISFKLVLHLYQLDCGSDQISKSGSILQILELLVEQSTRWYDAHIELHESGLPVLYMVKDKLPMLHTMRVNVWSPIPEDHDDIALMNPPHPIYADLFQNTPKLRCLHLCGFAWKVDWSGLAVIHLRYPYLYRGRVVRDGLSRAGRLEELNIYGKYLPLITPITLPSLKILRTGYFGKSLTLFRTPMLQELCIRRITTHEPEGTDFRDTLSAYLPSLSHLTKLTLCSNRRGDVEILLQSMPAVLDLCLYLCEPEANGLIVGRSKEDCLSVCKTDFLKLLMEHPKVHCLTTLTVGLLSSDENCLANITTWMRRKSLPEGVHRFDELEHLSLVFDALADAHSFGVLKQHLEAEGIRNSIRKINKDDDNIVLDIFIDYDELCY